MRPLRAPRETTFGLDLPSTHGHNFMPVDIIIRPARTGDIPDLSELLRDLFSIESDFTPDREKQARALGLLINADEGRSAVFVAELSGRVVGMCSVQAVISTAEGGRAAILKDLVVHQEFRGQGVGAHLLSEVHDWCRSQTITRIQLLADKDNLPAFHFYNRQGWQTTRLTALRRAVS